MKKSILLSFVLSIFFTSCARDSSTMWEETKTASRYLQRHGQSLFAEPEVHQAVTDEEDFFLNNQDEYVALAPQDLVEQKAEKTAPQPKVDAGAKGSNVPSIEKFQSPSNHLASIFKSVYFNTDEHVLRHKEHFAIVQTISEHLKKHKNMFLFVEGHCDDRASERYNLALGARRANFIRNLLVKNGANPNQVYTISYGKERPIAQGTTPEARAKNRRVEFKIFDEANHYVTK